MGSYQEESIKADSCKTTFDEEVMMTPRQAKNIAIRAANAAGKAAHVAAREVYGLGRPTG